LTVASVDAGNLAWLKETVAEVGWPGRSMVGEDGAHAAWLLAQHADRDPAFQRRCLDLVTQAARRFLRRPEDGPHDHGRVVRYLAGVRAAGRRR
jgi:hypothetical protein